jgi:DNA polymerase IV
MPQRNAASRTMPRMGLRTLFLDLNSYFASVEQHVQPHLRGRPVAVAPITSDSGCCIAASYEAKRMGVKTGTRVGEAKRLCPDVVIVDARPRLYVRMHHRVLAAVDKHIPVDRVHSIDEVSCTLDRTQRTRQAAEKLAKAVKAQIARECGRTMRCSIGIAPNRPLAKLGTDMFKPDGLAIFDEGDVPSAFEHLSPQELAGIGPQMMKRLKRQGITTIKELMQRDQKQMRELWGGVVGERWWYWLRGEEVHERTTQRRSLGHQHVLAPDVRSRDGARAVAFRLLLKAAARLRHEKYAARTLTLALRFTHEGVGQAGWNNTSWHAVAPLGEGAMDTPTILDALSKLWEQAPHDTPLLVSVTLSDLVTPASVTLPLFSEEAKRGNLSKAMDAVNQKFGANTVFTANMQDARGHGSGGIAFNFVPDLTFADSVKARQRTGGEKLMSDAQLDALIEAGLAADAT